MNTININHLRRVDLNLLPVFVALMQERNLTRAAERLNLGQPAVSAALKRLREAVDDRLFVRSSRGMMPTGRALALMQSLEPALGAIHAALAHKPVFQPKDEERVFRLGMSDSHEQFLMPPLMARLRTEAPKVRVVVLPLGWSEAGAALDSARVDLVCGYLPALASWHTREHLFDSAFQCMFDRKRVGFSGALTLARYLALPHLIVSSRGEFEGPVDDALARLGKSRHVVMSTSHFWVLPAVLKRIPAVATLPEHTARHLAREARLEVCNPPVELHGYESSLAWLRVRDDDPAHRWLRATVRNTAEQAAALR
jgi:DNA-binding transcriptional LysR family regulator